MKIVLGSDGSIELTRGEHITRGQNKSRQVFIEWAEGVSPIDTGQFLADNMVVEMCITRPDGEQSGWLTAVKVDGEIKYLYILQAWDTAVSGQASLQVRWYDITQEESNRIIEVSNEAFFIVDNGKIAQPLNLSSENYNDIVLRFITPLSTQAFRKYNINALPDTVTYEPDGAKTAPALFYNFTHEVVDIVPSVLNQGASYVSVKNTCDGFLLVDRKGSVQTEVFFTNNGKIYIRVFSGSPASEFKDIFEQWQIKSVEQQRSINGLLSLIVDKINYSDIVDNLESLDDRKPLSAKQGKTLKDMLNAETSQREGQCEAIKNDLQETQRRTAIFLTADNDGNVYVNDGGAENG